VILFIRKIKLREKNIMFHKKLLSPIVVSALMLGLFLNIFGQTRTPNTVFSNTTPITINSATGSTLPIPASLYPSNINVTGMSGNITRVAVTLTGLSKERIADLDFLLVSPSGAKFVFFSDGASSFSAVPGSTDAVFTFSDDASSLFPNPGFPIFPGNYKPTSGDNGNDTFPAPAPATPYNQPSAATFASTFNGASPNGIWSLYAVDDLQTDAGSLSSGWSLTITTTGSPQTFTNSALIEFNDFETKSSPYGTSINVSGLNGVISNVKVTLTGLSHQSPQDIDILLVSPIGTSFILMSDVGGNFSVSNTNLTFDDAATNVIFNGFSSGTYKPSNQSPDLKDFFSAPAPLRPYYGDTASGLLSSFKGFNPNGEWKLFVVDDTATNTGSISGGWSLDITTTPLVLPPFGCSLPSFATTAYAANVSPTNLAVGDFNNDNKQDVVVTNQISNDISVLLGTGTGSFSPQTLINSGGSGPYGIATGNFNADANLDFVVTNSGANTVSLYLGNGNGTFSSPNNFTVGASPLSVAVGDFNNDGKKDIAVANFGGFFSGAVSILLGNGTGGFGIPRNLRTATQPSSVLVGKFRGSSNDDIAVTNFGANSVSIFFGNGTGTFSLFQTLSAFYDGPVAMEFYDYSGDGTKDLIVANYNSNALRSFFGTGLGFVTGESSVNIGENPIALVRANILGGTFDSLAVALNGIDQIGVSNFSSIVSSYSRFSVGLNPSDIDKGDFNGDGKIDLITANSGSNDVSVLLNTCQIASGNLFDFDGDRVTDLSVYRASQSRWFSRRLDVNIGQDKVFARPTDVLVPADYDGDGTTDYGLFRPENGFWSVSTFSNSPIHFQQFGLQGDIPAPADFDGDRKADIAVFRPSNGTWYIRRSSDNSFQTIPFGSTGDKPVAADYDGDGKADIAVYRPSSGVWYIFQSSNGQFDIRQFGISTDKIIPADYDADGKADLAVFRDGTWYLLKTTGGFAVESWGIAGDIPVPGDYDSDGRFDLAVFRPSDTVWYVRRSSAGNTAAAFGISTDFPLPSAYVR
jgi:subtilisin-like proprotein convertase family protein